MIDGVFFNDKEIVLTKKDSLVVIIETYTAYNSTRNVVPIDTVFVENIIISKPPEWQTVARVSKQGNTFYVRVVLPNQWNGSVVYNYKGTYFTATKKSEFDNGYTGYAP